MSQDPNSKGKDLDFHVYTIYFNPADYPDKYVSRRHVVKKGGVVVPDEKPHDVQDSLELIRESLPQGLYKMDPLPGDEPQIVENWI